MTPRDDDAPHESMPDRPSRRFAVADLSGCPEECQRRWEQQRRDDLGRASDMAECRAKLETGAGTFNRMRADIAAVRQYIEQEARAMHEEHLHEISDVRSRLEKEAGEVRARVEEAAKAAVPKTRRGWRSSECSAS